MQMRVDSTRSGFDELINSQKAEPGTARVTLAQFDDKYEVVYSNLPIDEVPPLVMEPRGMTAMNDAIGKLITDVGSELAALSEDERPGLVIVVIMTDGAENASQEFDSAAIKKMIGRQEKVYGWKFIFLGSGIDVAAESAQRGMNFARSMAFNADAPVAVAAAYQTTSGLIGTYRGMAAAGASPAAMDAVGFTDDDRDAAKGAGRESGESQQDWKSRLKARGVVGSSR